MKGLGELCGVIYVCLVHRELPFPSYLVGSGCQALVPRTICPVNSLHSSARAACCAALTEAWASVKAKKQGNDIPCGEGFHSQCLPCAPS